MKIVILGSCLSFLIVFGGLFAWVGTQLRPVPADTPGTALPEADVDAAELAFAALAAERAGMDVERSRLERLRDDLAVREAGLRQERTLLEETIEKLRSEQVVFNDAREAGATKLAKMFDSMKPHASAPILSSLDADTALDILVRMKERAAAKLLSELDPGLAADLSARLSLRGGRRS